MSGTDSTGICAYLAASRLSQPRGITACAYRRGVTFSSPDLGTLKLAELGFDDVLPAFIIRRAGVQNGIHDAADNALLKFLLGQSDLGE